MMPILFCYDWTLIHLSRVHRLRSSVTPAFRSRLGLRSHLCHGTPQVTKGMRDDDDSEARMRAVPAIETIFSTCLFCQSFQTAKST